MAVSIRIVMSLLMTVVAIITAVIGFTPTYIAGLRSVQDTMKNFRSSTVARTAEHIDGFLDRPWRAMTSLQAATKRNDMQMFENTTQGRWGVTSYVCDLAQEHNNSLSVVAVGFLPYDAVLCQPKFTGGGFTDVPMALLATAWSATYFHISHDPVSGNYTRGADIVKYIIREIPLIVSYPDIPLFTARATFTPVIGGPRGLKFTMGAPLFYQGAFVGAFYSEVGPAQVMLFLRSLGMRPRGRAFVLDRSNGVVAGISWSSENVSEILRNFTTPPFTRTFMKRVSDFRDPLIKRLVATLGASTIVNATVPFATDVGKGSDRVYVDFVDVVRVGITLRVVLALPEIDYLEEVYRKRTGTIAGVCSALVLIILLGVVFSHMLTKPLNRVADRMYATASFQDDEADDPPSLLSEVREMQTAYGSMKGQLNTAKSFLPITVFRRNMESDDENERVEMRRSQRASTVERQARSKNPFSELKEGADAASSSSSHEHNTPSSRESRDGPRSTRALFTEAGTETKLVSVLIVNVLDTNPAATALGPKFSDEHRDAVAAVSLAVRTQKGVLDSFHGDHFVVTFNAVNTVYAHAKRAALTAFAVKKAVASLPTLHSVSVGMASGTALVGNMGSNDMRRFCTVGAVFSEAVALERMTGQYRNGNDRIWALCTAAVANEAQYEVYVQNVDIQRVAGKVQLVASVEAEKAMEEAEWMYQLQGGEAQDPFVAINATLKALSQNCLDDAAQAFAGISEHCRTYAGYLSAQRLLAASVP